MKIERRRAFLDECAGKIAEKAARRTIFLKLGSRVGLRGIKDRIGI
jgi:hypothetical protein